MMETLLAAILVLIAVGEVPVFRTSRATLALGGAVVVLVLGALPLDQAWKAIDWNTLALLFSMMVFSAHLRLAGFFNGAGVALARIGHSPRGFLALVLVAGALLSALFINDTVVLLLTPLVCELTLAAALNPLPYLVGLAVSANIGSMTTPIGNPQNILIASSSGLGFGSFAWHLLVPALVSLAVAFGLLNLVYGSSLRRRPLHLVPAAGRRVHRALLIKSAVAFAVMTAGFVVGLPLALAALTGACVLLFTRRVKPAKVLARIDGGLLLFFAALFVITRAAGATAGFQNLLAWSKDAVGTDLPVFAAVSAVLSNLISNVPAVMVLSPLAQTFPQPENAWMLLAGITTLAGNLTLLGSVANLIVAESAKHHGIQLRFGEYLKVGLPLALVSMTITVMWLLWS